MSQSEALGGKEGQLSSKVFSGIANSSKKVASGGSSVVSGIKTSTSKVASGTVSGIKSGSSKVTSGGSKAISGIASGGSKAIHTITSPIGSAVRHTVDKVGHHSSHGSTSSKDLVEEETTKESISDEKEESNEGVSEGDVVALNEKQESKTNDAPSSDPKWASGAAGSASSSKAEEANATETTLLTSVEATANKFFVKPVKGAADLVAEGGNKLLVNPVKGAAHKVAEGGKVAAQRSKEVLHMNSKGASRDVGASEQEEEDLGDVPPDATLEKMNVIINKRLKDVSIQNYYETAWSEGHKTNKKPLYGPWLKESGKQDIKVGDWEFAADGKEFVGDWDDEKYQQKRIVTFVFNKQIPFQMGPTLAKVKHTQYCRVEGNDKCVLAMTIEMQGVPYSDCFNVEIRWVATRSGNNDLSIQVGLFVNFVKQTIMASKIRSGTTEQTTEQQVQLFRKIKDACGAESEEAPVEAKEASGEGMPGYSCSWLTNILPFGHKNALANRDDEIAVSAKSADKKMREVITVLSDSDPSDQDPEVLEQLVVVNDALDKILAS